MNCPTCSAPNQTSGKNCRKCGVLVISFGGPSKTPAADSSLPLPGLGTLLAAAVLAWAAYAIWWPKPQDVAPQRSLAAAPGAFQWSDLLSGGKIVEKLKGLTLARGARKQEDGHANAMVQELENGGAVAHGELEVQSAAPAADGSSPSSAR